MTRPRSRPTRWLLVVAAMLVPAMLPAAPLVAAASDLQFALTELGARFTEQTGDEVRIVFGSSGNFARQIRQGAPFELYLSADEAYVDSLADAGLTRDRGTLYAVGRLALVAPKGSALTGADALERLTQRLADGRLGRFAIANPEHAPYGRRAREALERLGLWNALGPHLVFGENVSQTAQFALSGSTDGGLVAYSLALAPAIAARADHLLLAADLHGPLRQRMVLLRGAGALAVRFHDYLLTPPARAVLARYGFVPPPVDAPAGP